MSLPLAAAPTNRFAIDLIESIVRDAESMADLTADYLHRLGVLPPLKERKSKPVALPRQFLLELGAILRLDRWQRAGLHDHLGADLPPAETALDDLFARFVQESPGPRADGNGVRIAMDVFKASIARLAWGGRAELHADVVLDQPDDDRLLEALADFLWAQRHAGSPRG